MDCDLVSLADGSRSRRRNDGSGDLASALTQDKLLAVRWSLSGEVKHALQIARDGVKRTAA